MERGLEVGRKPLKLRKRRPADALTFSVNHWIRVEALAIFHEGEFTAADVAGMIGEDVKIVRGHIKELYDSGCIEIAGYKKQGGVVRTTYRGIVRAVVSDETYREMPIEERNDLNGAVVQGLHVESACSYRNGKMDSAEQHCFYWESMLLDAHGEQELHDHLIDAIDGAKEIQARAINRLAESEEEGRTRVVAFLGFPRGRAGRPEGGYRSKENTD